MQAGVNSGSTDKTKPSESAISMDIPVAVVPHPAVGRIEPSLAPLIKQLGDAQLESKRQAPEIEVLSVAAGSNAALEKRTSKSRKRLGLVGCMLLAGVFGHLLGSGRIDGNVLSDAATNSLAFVNE